MAVPTNIGKSITRFNTGWDANVSGSVSHTPATLTSAGSSLASTKDGDVIQGKSVAGTISVNHKNVRVIDCKAWMVRIADGKTGCELRWCEFGRESGNVGNTTQINGGDYLMYRCKLYGAVDHTRPNWGNTKVIENWFGPPWSCRTCHGGERAHCDPFQPHPPPGGTTYGSLLVQGNRFDVFPFDEGLTYLSELNRIQGGNLTQLSGTGRTGTVVSDIGGWPATCGSLNAEYSSTKNVTIRDNYFDVNAHQFLMIQNNEDGPIRGTVFIDNIIRLRRPLVGKSGYCNIGGSRTSIDGPCEIYYRNNLDAETGEAIRAFYKTPTSINGTVKTAGPSSSYPSFYTDAPPPPPDEEPPPPDPVRTLVISSPTEGAVYTSGPVVFVGSADEAAGDTDADYSFFDYYVSYPDPTNASSTKTAFVDHDQATANTGFTFSNVTAAGAVFTDRSGVQHTVLGEANLKVVGILKSGTTTAPTKSINVVFGDVETPPTATDLRFEPVIQAVMTGSPDIDSTIAGIPASEVGRRSRKVPATFRTEWFYVDVRNGREVVLLETGDFVYRDQA